MFKLLVFLKWKFIKWSLETFFNHNEIKNIFMDEYKKAVKIVISDLQSASNKKIFLSASLHKNHKKTLKIGTSGIRIWGIGIRLPKWSEYIRISDNSDIRTSTLLLPFSPSLVWKKQVSDQTTDLELFWTYSPTLEPQNSQTSSTKHYMYTNWVG